MAFVISLCKGRVYILNTAFGAIWVFILFNICFINSSFTSCSPSVLLFLYISPIYSFQVEILYLCFNHPKLILTKYFKNHKGGETRPLM